MASSEALPDPYQALGINPPRITIQFCTQCKWMLRAAYYAQELLSTFSTSLGEVSLQPSMGGTFVVKIYHSLAEPLKGKDTGTGTGTASLIEKVLWDRKVDGGFPETKELKRRVRDVVEPQRNLGHVDREHPKARVEVSQKAESGENKEKEVKEPECEDCK